MSRPDEISAGDRWQRTKQLFQAALELEPHERPAFLARSCSGDPALKSELERLLEAQSIRDEFLEPLPRAAEPGVPQPDSLVGERIGAYELTELIASGGMGEVYLALRADGQFSSRAAIKVIRPGLATSELLSRFQAERQTLASMNHPNIARLLDGGATLDGRPYLVMEFVEGRPIDQYCDAQGCSVAGRIELFRKICEAVQYAHQNLVVHRDLKPGNILITAAGEPKLLDFGIAKLLGDGDQPESTTAPNNPLRFLTPEYASPEHVLGERITTASDVYSLGVILYELLTGRRPYRIESRHPRAIERSVCETDPERPSSVVAGQERDLRTTHGCEASRLRRQLRGDLDNVVLMAMRKQQERRYSSAQQLSDDLRRYLEGEPVSARRDTFGYRAAKFVRRNCWAVTGGSTLMLALIAGVVGTTWQRNQALANLGRAVDAEQSMAAEAQRARTEAETARAVAAFLVRLFQQSDPNVSLGSTITARSLLDAGAARIVSELASKPEIQASLMDAIGVAYQSLGLLDPAERLLSAALEIRKVSPGGEHPAVAASLDHLGTLRIAQGDYDTAQTLLDEALEMRRGLLGSQHPDVAVSLNNLGALSYSRGDYQAAIRLFREALEMRRSLLGAEHVEVAQGLNNLAALLRATGSSAEAESLYREALAVRRQLLGEQHPDVAQSLNNLAVLLLATQRYEQAEQYCRQALAMRQEILGNDHPDTVQSLDNLGGILQGQGKFDAAEQIYREALATGRRLLGDDHPDVAITSNNLAMLLFMRNDFSSAEPLLRQCLRVKRTTYPEGHWRIAVAENALGTCLSRLGRFAEAEPLVVGACPVVRRALGEQHVHTLKAVRSAAELYEAWGQPDKAAPYREMLRRADPQRASEH